MTPKNSANFNEFKFPLAHINSLVHDPMAFALPAGRARYGRPTALRDSLFRYHHKHSKIDALGYLQKTFDKNSWKDVKSFEPDLLNYIENFEQLPQHHHIKSRMNVGYLIKPLKQENQILIHGQISRFDITGSGYAAWIFGKGFDSWKNDHRFPILQLYFSRALKIPADELTIGIYDITAGNHESCSFSSAELEESDELLKKALSAHFNLGNNQSRI